MSGLSQQAFISIILGDNGLGSQLREKVLYKLFNFPFENRYVILIRLSERLDRLISHASGYVLRAHIMGEGLGKGGGG